MKFLVFEEKNLVFYIPIKKPFIISKYLKPKKTIEYKYTKSKNYLLNCNHSKDLKHIVFIKHKSSTDIIYVFRTKEFFIKGGTK